MEATTMIVSRGLGNSLFPLRLHNFPELVAVTLKKGIAASEMK
jgi:predicted MPP superfamily phosphohydrolase